MKNFYFAAGGILPKKYFPAKFSHLRSGGTFFSATLREKLPLLGKVLLLLIFFVKIDTVKGQDHLDGINKVIGAGHDQFGAYIDFAFTYWNDNNYNSWLDGGDLYCLPEKGNEFQVAHMETTYKACGGGGDGDKDSYPVYIASYAGTIVAKTWEGSDYPDESEYPADYVPNANNWHVISSNKILEGAKVDNNSRVYLRWYVPNEYVGQRLTFRYHWSATIDCPGESKNEDYTGFGIVPYTTIIPLSTPALSWDFSGSAPGKFAVHYTYSSANQYKAQLSFDGQTQYADAGTTPSGTFDVSMPVSAQRLVLPFTASAQLTPFSGGSYAASYTQTQNVLIPAYVWPDDLQAVYDDKDTITLTWHISSMPYDDIITGDNFEVQRSTDSTFQENVKTVGSLPYDNNQTDYSLKDDLSDIRGGSHVYYRLRRTKSSSQWGWAVARKTDIAIILNTSRDTTKDTAILDESDGPKAYISFDKFKGAWLSSTKFSIRKTNVTTNEISAIDLTEDQARSGQYVDENISYCKQYTYSIQLTLGNGYASPPESDVPGSILAVQIGTISGMTSSKGYFPDRVELRWQSDGGFDNYLVKRRKYGSTGNFTQITSVAAAPSGEVQTDDSKADPGVYYEYMVVGTVNCSNTVKYSDTLYDIGFRSPTGNIYGRVTYANGQAVQDAAIRLEDQDGNAMGQSIYLNGNAASYLRLDSLNTPFADSAFTVEAWIKPDDASPRSQVIFSRQGQYELGFDDNGRLYFDYNGRRATGDYKNGNGIFVHVAGIHSRDSLFVMLNDSLIASMGDAFQPAAGVEKEVYIGRSKAGNNFKGYLDEMLAWNIALQPAQIARDYTRMLAGDEQGLAAYWRFDETITDQFYDISHHGDQYNRNDGTMDASQVKRANVLPTPGQLALKAYTDSSGNYAVTGIPYIGANGTLYTVVPLLGTHQFDPVSVNRLFSASSPSFTVDFTDKSSFPVSGYVYYRNSTVPVEGVQFKIDGVYAQESNGNIVQTDASGRFTISVPVGTHQVQALKNNHVFVNDGRLTDRFGNGLNYQDAISERVLYDSTTIRFIGRVAGGAVQDAYPLGHSLSVNNLGKTLSITMKLPSGTKYVLNAGTGDSTVIVDHLLPSDQTDSSKLHKTRIVWQQDQVVIYPDSLTGEFAADLIPEKFNVDQVNATGWGDLLEGNPVALDFSNKFVAQQSVYNYEDSTQQDEGTWNYSNHSDTVFYNDSYKFIKRVNPGVSIVQLNGSGKEAGYFGDSLYQSLSLTGEKETIPLINNGKTGKERYLFGHPVFTQGVTYHFKISAFEEYPFYESVQQDGKPVIAQENGRNVIDQVPTQDGEVSIFNTIRNGTTEADTLSLDSTGTGHYDFVAGDPVTIAPGLKGFSATIRFGQATDVSWNWLGDEQMQVFVTGSKQEGTDFVTAGPNKLLMVLRDPPGSRSYSYAEQGSTISSTSTYTGSMDNTTDVDVLTHLGEKVITWEGVGAGLIEEEETIADLGVGVHYESHTISNDTKVSTTTLTTRFQTSDEPTFVGAPADLFVGYSTNITYGQSDNLSIIKRDELLATDTKILDPGAGSSYLVVERGGINMGEKFGTLFAYPQQHIETVLIPNLVKGRNMLLLPPSTPAAKAQQDADNSKTEVYVSKLPVDDARFGKSNNDTTVFGDAAKTQPVSDGPSYTIYFPRSSDYRTDTIMTINQYIRDWEQALAHNEKEKLDSKLLQNYSFHAGNNVNYSEQTSFSHTQSNSFNIVLSGSVLGEEGGDVLGIGVKVSENASIGTSQGGSTENTNENSSTIGFELAADGVGEYISVDANKADDGGFAFRTKGGETECPYEGANLTRYYQPGTLLDQPTAQMDKPAISVDNPVANNVPSTQQASFTLTLSNASEAEWSTDFVLSYGNTDSVKGATISVDGVSIANGRTIPVIYGENVTKVLTITKGPDAMDYNNIPIVLHSACQYDPTGYQALIADTVLVSAHFVPSCSNVNIKSPANNWVLNTLSPVNPQGKRYLPVTINQFDESNSLFDHIELQYKPSSNSQWITVMSFYADSAKYNDAQGNKAFITNAQEINYNLEMDDASFNDQKYDIRALAVCRLGPGDFINTPSTVVSGVKDTYFPRLFGSPQPANGVLGAGDEIRLNFNEPIAAGLLTPADFQVTGIRNGTQGDHSVAVSLDGQSDYMTTEFEKNLGGRDITAEMWVLPGKQEDATLFSQGNVNESLEMAFTADNHLQVTVGKKKISSDKPLDYKQGEWAHVALVYHAADSTLSAFYNFQEVIHGVKAGSYNGIGPFEFGRSISGQNNYFAGKMHGLRVWTKALSATDLQVNSLTRLSGAEDGLMAYYPMTEGKGNVVFDKAHGNNAALTGKWSTPPGKAVVFNGNGYIKTSTGAAPVTPDMDYTVELWFKAQPGQTDAALASDGKGDGTDPDGSKNLFFLGFEKGLLTFENNGFRIQADGDYLDNQWHQLALAVNRNSGVAQWYVDGVLNKYFDARNLGGIASAYIYLGARQWFDENDAATPRIDRYFKGSIDEFRIWNTYLGQELIADNSNVRLKGDELGLMLYYPFETYFDFQNNKEMGFTLADQKIQDVGGAQVPDAVAFNAAESDDMAPIKDAGPVANLQFDYVPNNDALIINLQEPAQSVDKTIVTFQAKNVRDLNGNPLVSPITWTAYIDQNPLKWGDDALNLTKNVDTSMQFTSYIQNKGGSIEHFMLDNLPAWLTASPLSGTVDPEGKQVITFTVNAGLNIGTYDEIVYMRNDNGETESLPVNLKVEGQKPDWKVNPADFKYNMTLYGKIRIDNIFSADAGDMLAAFANGKCVGVTNNTYYADNDLWYAFLTVYSDSVKQGGLEFRIWDASTGKIYQGLPSMPISFTSDTIIGSSRNPVIFDGKEMLFRDIELNAGWNWISFALINPAIGNIPAMLANGTWQSGDIVKHDERGFDQYATAAGWIGTLPGFDNVSLFKLRSAKAQTLSTSGALPDVKNMPITVRGNRWNYISYLPQVNMTVKEALADYQATDEDVIKSQTGFAMYDPQNGWVGNLTYLEPGKGYMLYRKDRSDTKFVYPSISGGLDIHRVAGIPDDVPYLNEAQAPVQSNFSFADNMTMVAAASAKDFVLYPGDKIRAYVNGELRGEAQAMQNPVTHAPAFFFNISGDEQQPVYFNVERNGKTVARSATVLNYQSNSELGFLKHPLELQFSKAPLTESSTGVSIFPNPFREEVNIRISLAGDQRLKPHKLQVAIYDRAGHLVLKRTSEYISNGQYQTQWDGRNAEGVQCNPGIYFIHISIDDKPDAYKVIKLD